MYFFLNYSRSIHSVRGNTSKNKTKKIRKISPLTIKLERKAETELPEVGFESAIFSSVAASQVDTREGDKGARTVVLWTDA